MYIKYISVKNIKHFSILKNMFHACSEHGNELLENWYVTMGIY